MGVRSPIYPFDGCLLKRHSKNDVLQTIAAHPTPPECWTYDILHGMEYLCVGGQVFMHPDIYNLICVEDPTFAHKYGDMVCVRDWMPERTVVTFYIEPQLSPNVVLIRFHQGSYASLLRDLYLQGYRLIPQEAFYSAMTERDRLCIHPNMYTLLKIKDPMFESTVKDKVFLWSWLREDVVVFYQSNVHWEFECPPISLTDVM